jgi:hypothetical protein
MPTLWVKGTGKVGVTRRQSRCLPLTKVKTAPMDAKTAPMDNKTPTMDDKTPTMFGIYDLHPRLLLFAGARAAVLDLTCKFNEARSKYKKGLFAYFFMYAESFSTF